jgi:hypothetical protein
LNQKEGVKGNYKVKIFACNYCSIEKNVSKSAVCFVIEWQKSTRTEQGG